MHWTTMGPTEWRKWTVLVAAIWIQAFTGTNFDFPSYSTQLKNVLNISQVELNYLSMASDFGKLFGWCSGVLLLYFPTWVVVFLAALLGLFGYGLQWLLIQKLIFLPYFMAFILCLSAGCSITWFNTVCFVLCIKNFPNNWPLAVSLSVSYNGITAALYNLVSHKITSDDNTNNTSYLILNAVLPFITSIAALLPILQQKDLQIDDTPNKDDDTYIFTVLYILAVVTGLYLFFLDIPSQNILIVVMMLVVLPLVLPKVVCGLKQTPQVEKPSYNLVEVNKCDELMEDSVLEKDELGEEHSVWLMISRCDFWLYYLTYFCGGTIGLVYSNNLGQISQSLGYGSKIEALVSIFSTCSFFGRLISAIPDLVGCYYSPQMTASSYSTRTGWLALSLVPMPVAFLVLVLSDSERCFSAATGLIGICSGFVFSAAVSITSELFGSRSSGINHNILITNIPLGSLLYGVLGGVIYDRHIKSLKEEIVVGGSRVCIGRTCYNDTFRWWGCISLLGLGSSFLLFLRTRTAYQRCCHNRNLSLEETSNL